MSLWKTTVEGDGEVYWWASLDGESWREVNQDFTVERISEIEGLFASEVDAEWKPMVFSRRYLEMMKHDPKIQSVNIEQLV